MKVEEKNPENLLKQNPFGAVAVKALKIVGYSVNSQSLKDAVALLSLKVL